MSNKVAFVTGASRGIGKEIAQVLGLSGYFVVVGYNTNQNLAEEVVSSIKFHKGKAIAVKVVVEDRGSVKKAIEIISRNYKPVDILVNNAGMAQEKKFHLISDADWDKILNINLKGSFICSQEVLPCMVEQQWGRIVNISSIGGQIGGIRQVHYAAAKAGLISLTRSLARLYGNKGITVNAVAPGLINTDMITEEVNSGSIAKKLENIPLERIGETKEVADLVAFLVSGSASYITGQTININGGMYLT